MRRYTDNVEDVDTTTVRLDVREGSGDRVVARRALTFDDAVEALLSRAVTASELLATPFLLSCDLVGWKFLYNPVL